MEKFRPGVGGAPEFTPMPVLLSKTKIHRSNILVGNDPVQTRFAEQVFGVTASHVSSVKDEDVLLDYPTLYQVITGRDIQLSPQLRLRVGIWSLSPIIKGSASATAVQKAANEILNVKMDRDTLNRACTLLAEEPTGDLRAALWEGVWIAAAEVPPEPEFWEDPWSKKNWMPKGIDPKYRLNSLYRELVGWVLVKDDDDQAARRFGMSPSKIKRLKSLALDLNRIYDSILELSTWRHHKTDPYICALKISRIWKTEY